MYLIKEKFSTTHLFKKTIEMENFSVKRLFYSSDLKSDEQICAFYLNAANTQLINQVTMEQGMQMALTEHEYQQTMKLHFMKDQSRGA